jgi:hypothetical protein
MARITVKLSVLADRCKLPPRHLAMENDAKGDTTNGSYLSVPGKMLDDQQPHDPL